MKKLLHNACRSLFAVMFVAGALTACTDTPDGQVPNNGTLKAPTPAIAGVSSNQIYIKWDGVENATTYGFVIDSGEARGGAPEQGVKYSANPEAIFSDLQPQVTYTIRVKAIAPVNSGWADSEYAEIEVKTAGNLEGELFDFTDAEIAPVGMEVVVTPKNPNLIYFITNASVAAIQQAGSLDAYALKQMQFYQTYPDGSWADMKKINMEDNEGFKKGEFLYNIPTGLYPGRNYSVVAIGIDLDTRAYLGADQFDYETPSATEAVTFEVKINSRGFRSVSYDILPDNRRAPYRSSMAKSELYAELTDAEIIERMISGEAPEQSGNTKGLLYNSLVPDTEYSIYVVGSVNGEATTELKTVKFKTRPFVFEGAGKSTLVMGPERLVYSNPGNDWAQGMVEVGANVTSPQDTAQYKVFILPKAECDAMNEQELGEAVYEAGANLNAQDFWCYPWTRDWHPFGAFYWPMDARVKVGVAYYMLALEWGPNGIMAPVKKFEFTPIDKKEPPMLLGHSNELNPDYDPSKPEDPIYNSKKKPILDNRGKTFYDWEQKNWYSKGDGGDFDEPGVD